MKRTIFMMFIGAGLLSVNPSVAQLNVSVNIGNQPSWAPEGYDEAQYYYMPDMDVYYDVPAHQFLYLNNRRWVRSAVLPAIYRSYDLYRVHKVAINDRDAWKNHDRDRKQYATFKGRFDQHPIRDSRDDKYTRNKTNWQNNRFKDNGSSTGRENGKHDQQAAEGRH
ncbi:MAG: hypothetical protein ABIQ88_03170 [Chitinophagaceae bacterium]